MSVGKLLRQLLAFFNSSCLLEILLVLLQKLFVVSSAVFGHKL